MDFGSAYEEKHPLGRPRGIRCRLLNAGGFGAIASTSEIGGWYKTLEKPTWNPLDYIFAPVWTMLYVMMAIAAWMVWKPRGSP